MISIERRASHFLVHMAVDSLFALACLWAHSLFLFPSFTHSLVITLLASTTHTRNTVTCVVKGCTSQNSYKGELAIAVSSSLTTVLTLFPPCYCWSFICPFASPICSIIRTCYMPQHACSIDSIDAMNLIYTLLLSFSTRMQQQKISSFAAAASTRAIQVLFFLSFLFSSTFLCSPHLCLCVSAAVVVCLND